MCRPCADGRGSLRTLLPREEGHALRSDGGEVESQKARSSAVDIRHVKAVMLPDLRLAVNC
jgi:hypothetical protein